MIRRLKSKDKINFLHFCSDKDQYSDFYITKDNKRYFFTDNNIAKKMFNNCLKHGDICYISENNNTINGILIVIGYSDKANRKYLKLFTKNIKITDGFLKFLKWNYKKDIYAKINNSSAEINTYKRNGFKFLGGRGSQVLLLRSQNDNNYKTNKRTDGRPFTKRRS